MSDPFAAWIKLQEDALKAQRAHIEAFSKWSDASGDAIRMQKSVTDATRAGLKAWDAALGFWGVRR